MDLVSWSTNQKFQEKHHVPHVCPNCRGVEPGPVMNQWFQGCFTSSNTWVLRAMAISLHATARWWHPDDQSVAGSDKDGELATNLRIPNQTESNLPKQIVLVLRRVLRRVYIINNNQSSGFLALPSRLKWLVPLGLINCNNFPIFILAYISKHTRE